MTRLCDFCKKPMGNSWHTETAFGQLEIYVHNHCSKQWKEKEAKT